MRQNHKFALLYAFSLKHLREGLAALLNDERPDQRFDRAVGA